MSRQYPGRNSRYCDVQIPIESANAGIGRRTIKKYIGEFQREEIGSVSKAVTLGD